MHSRLRPVDEALVSKLAGALRVRAATARCLVGRGVIEPRAAQGFNVIQVVALDGTYARANRYGQAPLVNNNPATPNDAYFQQLDYIVKQAATYGIYVAIVPTCAASPCATAGLIVSLAR